MNDFMSCKHTSTGCTERVRASKGCTYVQYRDSI